MLKRYITPFVEQDLGRKMVFVGGPRQVGKTTLARSILADQQLPGRYLNWDYDTDRQDILALKWAKEDHLLIFDELHKFPRWKSWIKGLYDVDSADHSFLVTGSARLDVYRRGGDSLLGRYHYWRLHPLTLDERPAEITAQEAFRRLMRVGGFPEPFLENNERQARRWRRERFNRVLREDIRDLEAIRNIANLGVFLDLLRTRVGGQIVYSNLAGDVQISPKTAKFWLKALQRMYILFTVRPFSRFPRAVLKAPKAYFYDVGDVIGEDGARFENLVAANLIKRLHFMEDHDGYRCDLRYIRDKEGREVDFAIFRQGVLEELIEVKYADETLSKHLIYYANRLQPKRATQIVANLKRCYDKNGIRVVDPINYFTHPPWDQVT